MRFTLTKLFIATALIALACAGMTIRTRWWAGGILTLTILLYVIVGLRAISLRKRELAAALAFSLVGGGYLLLATNSIIRGDLLTTDPLALIAVPLGLTNLMLIRPGNLEQLQWSLDEAVAPWVNPNYVRTAVGDTYRFFLIGHCVWSWLFALLAGWFAGRMYDRRQRAANLTPPMDRPV